MEASSRMLVRVALVVVWAIGGQVEADVAIGAAPKAAAKQPAVRPPAVGGAKQAKPKVAVSRPALQNGASKSGGGPGRGSAKKLPPAQLPQILARSKSLPGKKPPLKKEAKQAQTKPGKPKREKVQHTDVVVTRGRHVHSVEIVGVVRKYFLVDSEWAGTRYTDTVDLDVRLRVTRLAGNLFGGVLSQERIGGGWDKMAVEGAVDGNRISFHTTRMIDGKKRHLHFDGCFSGNHIETTVSGRAWNGSPATGSMTLWRGESRVVALR